MAFCKNCGKQLNENEKFCVACGQATAVGDPPKQQTAQQSVDRLVSLAQNTKDETGDMDGADIEKNKVYGGLAYFLFFLPLVACPESKYGRFHANQGLILLIMGIAGSVVTAVISTVFGAIHMWFVGSLVSYAVWLAVTVTGIIGLVNGFGGKAKELPVIGGIRIIK